MTKRTIAYIDGFNLYYGLLRQNSAYKWLDLWKFVASLVSANNNVVAVKFGGRHQAENRRLIDIKSVCAVHQVVAVVFSSPSPVEMEESLAISFFSGSNSNGSFEASFKVGL